MWYFYDCGVRFADARVGVIETGDVAYEDGAEHNEACVGGFTLRVLSCFVVDVYFSRVGSGPFFAGIVV